MLPPCRYETAFLGNRSVAWIREASASGSAPWFLCEGLDDCSGRPSPLLLSLCFWSRAHAWRARHLPLSFSPASSSSAACMSSLSYLLLFCRCYFGAISIPHPGLGARRPRPARPARHGTAGAVVHHPPDRRRAPAAPELERLGARPPLARCAAATADRARCPRVRACIVYSLRL